MAFQNESYIGELITIDYRDTLNLDSLQLNFCMEEAVLKNELDLFGNETTELKGIRRFNVFHYIEECNMLLPIETFHDEEKNMVSAKTDEDGIYCLVDMEKWLYGLEQSIEDTTESQEETPAVMSLSMDEEMPESKMVSLNEEENTSVKSTGEEPVQNIFLGDSEFKEETLDSLMQVLYPPMLLTLEEDAGGETEMIKDDRPIDIVYILQTEGNDEGFIGITWIFPSIWTEYLERSYSNMRVCILEQRKDGVYGNGIKNNILWHDDMEELQGYLQQIKYRYIPDVVSRGDAHVMILGETMGFREESAKFVVEIPAGVMEISPLRFERLMKYMSNCGINYSEVHDCARAYGGATNFMEKQINLTGGKLFSIEESPSSTAEDIPEHVRECMSNHAVPQKEFGAIVATGYRRIYLKEALSCTSGTDTDYDGLTDWEEVYTEMLHWDAKGNVILPTLLECIENAFEKSYVVEGLERFKEDRTSGGVPSNIYDEYMNHILKNTYILPIHSDPVRMDGDNDGYEDSYDMKPLNRYNNGKVMHIFSKENMALYDRYLKNKYNRGLFSDGEIVICMELNEKITLLQQCLEYLGYLKMKNEKGENISYGNFGGATRCALQLYQLNHGFDPIKYGEREIDINTYSDLVNNAINHGFKQSTIGITDKEKIYLEYVDNYQLNKKYYAERQVIQPPLCSEYVNAGITVTERFIEGDIQRKKEQKQFEDYYIYNYTNLLEKILYYGALEFHQKHYICGQKYDSQKNQIQYEDSELCCEREGNHYEWVALSVKNNAKYDIKVKERWDDWMRFLGEDISYFGSRFQFLFYGYVIDAEGYGNFLYGMVGNAGGYSEKELINFGSLYSFATTLSFDNKEDATNIGIGYHIYESKKKKYKFLH